MTNAKIVKILKDDAASKQRMRCSGCGQNIGIFGDVTDDNLVELKDVQELGSPDPIVVCVCDNCKKLGKQNEAKELVYERDGQVYNRTIFNLIKRGGKDNKSKVVVATDATGKTVLRSEETGKIVDKDPDEVEVSAASTPSVRSTTSITGTATTSTTTTKGKR